jgi:hypothetical protein
MSDPDTPEFAARRLAARARLDAIDDAGASDPYRRDWFAAVYETAGDDPAQIPWADLAAHPLLAAWLRDVPSPAQGWQTTGFDLSALAARWAAARFPHLNFLAADLFSPPADWRGAFDLVHECYTLQALPDAPRAEAMANIAGFVRRGGTLLVIARARTGTGTIAGPPWPLSRAEILEFESHGLAADTIEELPDPADGKPHWRATFRRG